MRIVLLPSAYAPAVGGVEELTKCLARNLTATGHTVEVWTIRHPRSLPAVDRVEGTTVRRFSLPLPAGKLDKAIAFAPGATRALMQTGRALRAFSPDVLHVQCFSANGVYASALSLLFGVPLVVTLQGETVMDDHDIYERSASLRLGLRLGLRRARTVTACSQFVLDDATRRFGPARHRGFVIPNGVETAEPGPMAPVELPFTRFVLGLGRVVEKKGFDLLIDAFAAIARNHPQVGLVVGGDGAARPDLLARAKAHGLADRVSLPGTLSRGQVAWAMHNATAFVLPSRIEPFGIVVLEALRAGLPAIVSARGGAPEIVRDGKEGLVVDPFNRDAVGAALDRVLNDAQLRSQLSEAGRLRATRYAWGHITDQYLAAYKRAAWDYRSSSETRLPGAENSAIQSE